MAMSANELRSEYLKVVAMGIAMTVPVIVYAVLTELIK